MSKPPPEPRRDSSELRRAAGNGDRPLESPAAGRDALEEAQRIAHVGSWHWNISSGSLDWSAETFRIFGFEPRAFDATYEGFLGFIHPDDREAVERAVSEALSGDGHYDVEHRVVRPKGEERVVHERGEVTFDKAGKPERMIGTVQDVTDLTRLREELARSEAYNRGLIEASADGLLTIDRTGVITDVNEQMCVLTGHSCEEIIGSEFALHCLDPEKAREGVRRTFKEGAVGDYILTLAHGQADGREFSFNATLYHDEDGEVAGIFASARDITLRRQAERALDAERTRFNNILEMLPAYLVLLTPDYHVPFANRFFRERFGEAKGRRCYEYLFNRTEPCEICETYTVLKTGNSHRWEWTGPDGRDYDIYDFPFTDADGSPLIMEMGIDVTEQKRLENEMRDAHLYTRSLIEAALDAQMTTDITGVITDVNAEMEKLTGRSRQELIGTRLRQYATDPARAAAGIERVLSDGIVRDYELTIEAKDGRQTDVAFHATTYFDQQGELRGIFASARDITERKRFEEERQVARFFELALDMAVITSLDEGRFVRVNPAFEQLLGWTAEELCASSYERFVHPDDLEPTRRAFEAHLDGREVINFDNRYLCKDGSYRWIRWRTTPPAESRLVYATARDVTEERLREEEREREFTRIRALGEMSAGLSGAATPSAVMAVIWSEALEALGATAGTLVVVSRDRTHFERLMTGFSEEIEARLVGLPIETKFPSGVCLKEGRELWFESAAEMIEEYPATAELLTEAQVGASIYLPLLSHGEAIACLIAHFSESRVFGEDDRAFAGAVAAQCAQALERARLYEQREQALDRTQALQRVTSALAAAATAEQVWQVVFEEAYPAIGADSGALGVLMEDGETVESFRTGVSAEVQERFATESIYDEVGPHSVSVREGREIWYSSIEDMRKDFPIGGEIVAEAGYKSFFSLPLVADGKTIGYLTARFQEAAAFSESDRAFSRTVADQCSQALSRAQLAQQRERALLRTQALQRVSAALTAAITPEDVLRVVFDEALSALAADSGALGLLSEDGSTIESTRTGLPQEVIDRYAVMSIEEHFPQVDCVREGIELWSQSVDDLEADYPETAAILTAAGYESFFCLPLREKNEPVGYLAARFREPRIFPDADRIFCRTVAEQCAQAISRARLHEQREAAFARTRLLQNVSAGLTQTATIEQVGEIMSREVFPLLGVRAGSVGLLDQEEKVLSLAIRGWERQGVERFGNIPLDADLPGPRCVRENRELWYRSRAELEEDFAELPPAIAGGEFEAAFFLPLEVRGKAIGFFSGFFGERRDFTGRDRGLFETVAEQCGQALSRARLHDELNESLTRTEALQRVSSELARAATPLEVVGVVFDEVFAAFAVDVGVLGLVNHDRTMIDLEFAGVEDDVTEIAIDDPLSPGAFCVRRREEIWLESPDQIPPEYPFASSLGENVEGNALFYVPLVPGGREEVIGFIAGRFNHPRRFTESEREFVRSVASRCAQTLVRVGLAEEREEALRRTRALQGVNAALTAAVGPAEVAEVVFEQALPAMGTVSGRLGVLARDGSELECLTHSFDPDAELEPLERLALDTQAPGPASVRTRNEYWYEKAADAEIEFPLAWETMVERGVGAIFYLPLGTEKPIGFLAGAFESERRFDEEERAFARSVAGQCAQALERARLYEEREQRAEASFVLDRVGDGIFRLDGEERIRFWNPAAQLMTGFTVVEALGKRVGEVFEGWGDPSKALEPAPPGRPAARRSLPFVFRGVELWLSISGVQTASGAVFAFHDVTAEHELEQRQRDFIATVSHELRTPLASVYGAVRTLERSQIDPIDRELVLRAAVDQSERLRGLIDEILLANEAGSTQMRMRDVVIDPIEVVHDVVEGARPRLPVGFGLEVSASESIPPLHVDPDRLHQVLANLVDNAIKFSPQGSCIHVEVSAPEENVLFRVADEGPGIPPSERERIFDRFYRLDPSQSTGIGGSGLGLFICRELVERMGGKIGVDAPEGGGSVFWVELPRERRHPKA
jgi:PAS domain S-box-containing protein